MIHRSFLDSVIEVAGWVVLFAVIGFVVAFVGALFGLGWFLAKYAFLFVVGMP